MNRFHGAVVDIWVFSMSCSWLIGILWNFGGDSNFLGDSGSASTDAVFRPEVVRGVVVSS